MEELFVNTGPLTERLADPAKVRLAKPEEVMEAKMLHADGECKCSVVSKGPRGGWVAVPYRCFCCNKFMFLTIR